MKSPQELKKEWVAALRSGKYKQAHGTLSKPDGDCCLGVLCKVAGILQGGTAYYASSYDFIVDEASATCLPSGFRDYMGISLGFQSQLIAANDKDGTSFDGIADIIENENEEL